MIRKRRKYKEEERNYESMNDVLVTRRIEKEKRARIEFALGAEGMREERMR